MQLDAKLSRRDALKTLAAAGAGVALAGCGTRGESSPRVALPREPIRLGKVEVIQYEAHDEKLNKTVRHKLLCIHADDGTRGIGPRAIEEADLEPLAASLDGVNLGDHPATWKAMDEAGIGDNVKWLADMACWDLHGRRAGKPLAELLGQRRDRFRIYGDQRLGWYGGDVEKFASACADAAHNMSERHGIKLHFPGCYPIKTPWGTHKGIPLETALRILRLVREKVGPDTVLAWDPQPQEAGADNLDDARRILEVMDAGDWAWIESPLPADPEAERIEQWLTLRKEFKLRFELERKPAWAETVDQQVDARIKWVRAGAANQANYESLGAGITPWLRLRRWAIEHPRYDMHLNMHCHWAPHLHMAAALSDEIQPLQEYCGCPPLHLEGQYKKNRHRWSPAVHEGWVDAPRTPGVFRPDWQYIDAHRV